MDTIASVSVPLKKGSRVAADGLSRTMRPKARAGSQHGCPPGWLEESDPAGVILYMIDGPYSLPFPYRTGCPARNYPLSTCELMEFQAAVI
jgi:hypothetical protein